MNNFDPSQYGPVFASLLAEAPLNELGPGRPVGSMRETLRQVTFEVAFAPHKVADQPMAEACLAAMWLRYDFLDQSHAISQSIHTTTGSYWHGIMHRREPDYDNAKYWFRRVGDHPVFEPLCTAAREFAAAATPSREAAFLAGQTKWDPFRFVDLVAAVAQGPSTGDELCRRVQLREWELLFDFCYRAAISNFENG